MPTFNEQYHNPEIDRSEWPSGSWDDEPDKVVWVDDETDLDCMIVRNYVGALCGYVGVPDTHPLYGKSMNDDEMDGLAVHGGITFTAACSEEDSPEGAICHIPLPGRSDDIWWIGFDCSHGWDDKPGLNALHEMFSLMETMFDGLGISDSPRDITHGMYRDFEYVISEVESLAKQVRSAG